METIFNSLNTSKKNYNKHIKISNQNIKKNTFTNRRISATLKKYFSENSYTLTHNPHLKTDNYYNLIKKLFTEFSTLYKKSTYTTAELTKIFNLKKYNPSEYSSLSFFAPSIIKKLKK